MQFVAQQPYKLYSPMKFRHLSLLAAFLLLPLGKLNAQQSFVNLTPLPKQMSVQAGTFVFPLRSP